MEAFRDGAIAGFLCRVAVEVSWMWGRARLGGDVGAVWKIVEHAGRVVLREGRHEVTLLSFISARGEMSL